MPVAVEAPQTVAVLPHKLWTRDECFMLVNAGLSDLNRYELIEGALIQKMPKGQAHITTAVLLAVWLQNVFGNLFVVPEPTIDLRPEDSPTSAPEPDIIVLTRPVRELKALARPQDIQLIAEISDSSLAFDQTTKARLYARSGIVEYWIVDIRTQRVLVHRKPSLGGYGSIEAYGADEEISTLAKPAQKIRVREFLE